MKPSDGFEPTADERLHPGGGPIQKTYIWPDVFMGLRMVGYFVAGLLFLAGLMNGGKIPLGYWLLPGGVLAFGVLCHLIEIWAKKRYPIRMSGLTTQPLPVMVDPNPPGISFLPIYDIDDKRWRVEHDSDVRSHLSFWGVMVGGFGFGAIALMWYSGEASDPDLVYFMLIGLVGLGLYGLSYVIKPTSFIVFDRERGLLSYPQPLKPWKKDRVVNFWECEGRLVRYASRHGLMSYNMDLIHRPTQSAFMLYRNAASEISPRLDWNTLLWYMDNHLPLPPVPGLEPYQDAEWEQAIARMKRRGSVIQTPMTISNQTLFEIGVVDEHGRAKSS